jgi:hypothetical protein
MKSRTFSIALSLVLSASWGCGAMVSAREDAASSDGASVSDASAEASASDAGAPAARWEQISIPSPALERWGAAIAPVGDGRFYLYGGLRMVRAVPESLSDVLLADMRGAAPVITEVSATNAPPGRSRSCVAYDPEGRRLIMRGGRANGFDLANDKTWELDLATNVWTERVTELGPPGVVGCAMTYVSSQRAIYHYGGGFQVDGAFGFSDELWRFDLATNQWSRVSASGAGPTRGYDMTMSERGGTILLFGGGIGTQGNGLFSRELFTFDVARAQWTRLAASGPRPVGRRGHWMLVSADAQRILIGGGESNMSALEDVWLYDRARGAWRDLTQEASEERPNGQGTFSTALPGPQGVTATIFSGISPSTAPTREGWVLRVEGVSL